MHAKLLQLCKLNKNNNMLTAKCKYIAHHYIS